jgi:hypothetical protein
MRLRIRKNLPARTPVRRAPFGALWLAMNSAKWLPRLNSLRAA